MKLHEILDVLRTVAPESLAEPWDKPGLHAGELSQSVSGALLCIDLTPAVVKQAIDREAQLIVSYHPPIFEPLRTLAPTDWKTRALVDCVKRGIAIYSPHTALDASPDGLNHWLAGGLGEGTSRPIKPHAPQPMGKLVVFVPPDAADRLRDALAAAGAGVIGSYSRCSFTLSGQGTFEGDASTRPTVGQAGRLERVAEHRLEMVFPLNLRDAVIAALRAHHPYEEPAFDLYALEPAPSAPKADDLPVSGQGRIVTLRRPVSLRTLVRRIQSHLGLSHLTVLPAVGKGAGSIRTVGLCAGAGGSLLEAAGQIDAFFTGEMRYHDMLDASQRGLHVLLAGHPQTERPFLPVYRDRLKSRTGKAVTWHVARE